MINTLETYTSTEVEPETYLFSKLYWVDSMWDRW